MWRLGLVTDRPLKLGGVEVRLLEGRETETIEVGFALKKERSVRGLDGGGRLRSG